MLTSSKSVLCNGIDLALVIQKIHMTKSAVQQQIPSLTKLLGPALKDTFTVKLTERDCEDGEE